MEFSVIQGDIAQQEADALVNAAGTSLRMGSGVAGALRRAANGPINDEAMSNGPWNWGTWLSLMRTTSLPTTSSTRLRCPTTGTAEQLNREHTTELSGEFQQSYQIRERGVQ